MKIFKKSFFVTLLLLLCFSVLTCGCEQQKDAAAGNETAGEASGEASGETAPQDNRAYTLDMYLKVALGNTYEEVAAIMGNPGEAWVDGDVLKQYTWENQDGSNISVTFDDGKATAKTQAYLGPFLRGGDKVTEKMLNQLSEGSSLAEIEEVLGPGAETMRHIVSGVEQTTYQWSNSDGSSITIVFSDGKASDINSLML